MGELATMGRSGDSKIHWDKNSPDEVAVAKRAFEDLRAKGYLAFKTTKIGDKDRQIHEFDATAERIILSPPLRGGA